MDPQATTKPKGKPRGRKGGRKPSTHPKVRISVHIEPEQLEYLKTIDLNVSKAIRTLLDPAPGRPRGTKEQTK